MHLKRMTCNYLYIKIHHGTPIRMNSKSLQRLTVWGQTVPNVGKDLQQLELLYVAGGKTRLNITDTWNTVFHSSQHKLMYSIQRSNFTPSYVQKRNEYMCTPKDWYVNGHSNFMHNIQKMKMGQMSINKWMDKHNVGYLHNGILLRHLKMDNN